MNNLNTKLTKSTMKCKIKDLNKLNQKKALG
jgi:hypothetical protein